MSELDADFEISTNNLEAEYEINEGEHFDCSFEIYAAGATFSNIAGSPYDNEALASALNQKADNSTVEALSETVDSNYNTLDGKIDTHIADKTNPHEVTKAQVGLGNVDNTSDLNKPISTATQTALNGKQNTISDLSEIRSNASNGQSAYNTIQNYGDIVTYDASSFATSVQGQKADTALQPNDDISELVNDIGYITMSALGDYATLQELENGLATKQDTINDLSDIRNDASKGANAYTTIQTYGDIVTYNASSFATSAQGALASTALQPNDNITELNNNAGYITSASLPTVNNSTITFQKNNVTVGDINLNQPNNETINFDIPTNASDVNALPDTTTINDLTTTAQQNAIDSGANTTNIGQIATNASNISSLSTTVTNNYNTLDGRITSEVSTLNTAISTENTQRQTADSNLQSQIDAIVSSTDVTDIVGTYAELLAYDTSTLAINSIIKVLVDSTHDNASSYYEWDGTSWTYKGSEGPYATPDYVQANFVNKSTTVNNKPLSNNITLTASDVGALPSSTTIGNGILTIQNNSVDVDTFSANATSNKTINIVTPTKTSDLTNDSGFIDSSGLSNYATQTDLTNGLATKQDTISDLSTIRQNAQNGQSAYTTIGSYGDIVTYNASNFATSAQGDLADTALQQGDNISLLNNNAGYITGIGSSDVITALGYTPYNSTNPNGYITGISSSDVTTALGYTPYNSSNPNGYTSNVGTVTSVNNTQPDANGNVTISVSGGANTDLSNLTATGEAHFLKNTATGTHSLTIDGTSSTQQHTVNIGSGSECTYYQAVAIGTNATTSAVSATAIGCGAIASGGSSIALGGTACRASAKESYQIGVGTNSTARSLQTGFTKSDNTTIVVYQLLDGTTGLIPDARISTNIARASQIPTVPTNISSFNNDSGYITGINSSMVTTALGYTPYNSSNPSGYITSSSTQVASSRFDGQWVAKTLSLDSSTAVHTTTYNLGTLGYLPSDYNTYNYLINGYISGYNSNSTVAGGNIISEFSGSSYVCSINCSSTEYRANNNFIIPVNKGNVTVKVEGRAFTNRFEVVLCGYRRIGTNS